MVLILKTELSGDLRRIPLHNDFLTFDELHLMLCRVYGVDIGDDDKVKYRDADGDWITIADSNDLQLAILTVQEAGEKTLRLKIGSDGSGMGSEVLNDLREIRNMSISLIDRLAGSPSVSAKATAVAATVEQVSVAEEVETREEPVEEPVVEKPPSHELQAFDPIHTETAESIASATPSSVAAPVAEVPVMSNFVEPVAAPPQREEIAPTLPVAPVQPTPVVPAEVVQPVPVQPVPVKPEPTAASFFNSNASMSGDGFSMGAGSKPSSTAGSVSGSTAPTPTPVLPPSMQSQPYSQMQPAVEQQQQQPPVSAVPTPVIPTPAQPVSAALHGQQQQQTPQVSQASQYYQQQQQQYAQQQHYAQQQQQQYNQQYAQQYAQTATQQPMAQQQPQQQQQYGYAQYAHPQQQQQYGQQATQQPQQQSAPPAAPPSGPPQSAPPGGYRLNRNQRSVRPGYQ